MTAPDTSSLAAGVSANAVGQENVVRVQRPTDGSGKPIIFASPHSGRNYPDDLCDMCVLPLAQLRRSEDAYVDLLIAQAPEFGACSVSALFPRVFVDVNRSEWELDPGMFADRVPDHPDLRSQRATSGLGVIPRVGVEGRPLYRRRLRFAEARARLARYYEPYHDALSSLIGDMRAQFGGVVVIDMHSMPEHSADGADFVLGDRFGTSCMPQLTDAAEAAIGAAGCVAVRNTPYAGGYTTRHYGRPETGVHVLQIEINRSLYLDETRVALSDSCSTFSSKLNSIIKALSDASPELIGG